MNLKKKSDSRSPRTKKDHKKKKPIPELGKGAKDPKNKISETRSREAKFQEKLPVLKIRILDPENENKKFLLPLPINKLKK